MINILAVLQIRRNLLCGVCLFIFINIFAPLKAKVFDLQALRDKTRHQNLDNRSSLQIKLYTKEAINYLDELAIPFDNLKCAKNDKFCWWVLFHTSIGASSNKQMQKFAVSVPFNYQKNVFVGESHIAQYSAYYLLKKVSLNTPLQSGQTLNEYIINRDWQKDFRQNADKEPSWYFMVNHFYRQLPEINPVYNTERACQGGHYLVGLSTKKNIYPALFNHELRDYYFRLKQAAQTFTPADLYNPYKADLLTHGLETLCLSGHLELIDEQIFYANLLLLQSYSVEIEKERKKYNTPEAFVQGNKELAYSTGEILGHFRNGLKICSAVQKQF